MILILQLFENLKIYINYNLKNIIKKLMQLASRSNIHYNYKLELLNQTYKITIEENNYSIIQYVYANTLVDLEF